MARQSHFPACHYYTCQNKSEHLYDRNSSKMLKATFSASGRVMAQAVSRWPLTADAWVRAHVSSCWICGEQSGTGTRFLSKFFCFILSVAFHRGSPCSHIIWGMNSRPVGGCRSKHSLTPLTQTCSLTYHNCLTNSQPVDCTFILFVFCRQHCIILSF
jgi:hypothetical protein